MGHPVISIPSTYRQDHLFTSIVFLFVFLLFLSFVRNYPLCFFFSFIDTIFLIFYCCSSLTLFKVNNNIESVTIKEPINRRSLYSRSSGRLSASSINIFSVRTSKKYNSMERNSFGIESLSDMDLSASPYSKSPWSAHLNTNRSSFFEDGNVDNYSPNVLMGSLVREGGHIYSLAASGELLYTGSDSKNIRVWKNNREFSGFRSNSGLVKAIVISGDRIFTGHQDGKIRMWRISSRNPSVHRRVGTLPSFKDYIKHSMRPSSYVEIRRHKSVLWLKHLDAISCLSFNEDRTIIYSASWDKTFKVWRISDSKCLESVTAHDDAVNSLVAGFDGLVFTGSADGTVKVWRREMQGKGTKHFFSQTLLKQECAVTALAVNPDGTVIYAGSSDGLVNFWDRKSHLSHGGILMGHKLAVLCLVAAGNLLFSGSADMGICVWSKMGSDHVCLSLLTGHSGPIKCLAAARDHESVSRERRWILYSGSLDKSVRMWRISEFGPPMPFKGCAGSAPTVLRAAPSLSAQGRISEARH